MFKRGDIVKVLDGEWNGNHAEVFVQEGNTCRVTLFEPAMIDDIDVANLLLVTGRDTNEFCY